MTTIDVVIPVKDDTARLRTCLHALSVQTRAPDGVIVVDNASTEDVSSVADEFGVRCIAEPAPGIAAASSAGYDASPSDLIARLDADSVPPSDWIERIVRRFERSPDLDAVTGPGVFAALPRPLAWLADRWYMRAYFSFYARSVGRTPLFGSNFAMTRRAWRAASTRVHRNDPEVHDDLDLSFALPEGARVMLDPELRVTISARPFLNPIAFVRRIRRAFHTTRVNAAPRRSRRP